MVRPHCNSLIRLDRNLFLVPHALIGGTLRRRQILGTMPEHDPTQTDRLALYMRARAAEKRAARGVEMVACTPGRRTSRRPVDIPRLLFSADHMPGMGINSTISIVPSGIMKCGWSFSVAASASLESACRIE